MIGHMTAERGIISYDVSELSSERTDVTVSHVKLRNRCQILFFERAKASNQRRQDIDDEIRSIQKQLKVTR